MFFTTSSNSSSDGDRDQLGFRKLFGDNGHRGGARHRVDGGPRRRKPRAKMLPSSPIPMITIGDFMLL